MVLLIYDSAHVIAWLENKTGHEDVHTPHNYKFFENNAAAIAFCQANNLQY